jgi:VanZ family protein
MNEFKKQYKHYTPPFLWAVIIFGLCTMSRNQFPDIDQWLKVVFDKLIHVLLYTIFSILLIVSFIKQNHSYKIKQYCVLLAITISALYGIFIEFYQTYLVSSRSGDYQDIIANVSGSIIGLIGFYIVYGKPKNYI